MCWCVLDGSVCVGVQGRPFDLFGWVFLVHVGMYLFVLHDWLGDLHGYGSVVRFDKVVSSHAGSCFLYFTTNFPPMIIQSETARQYYKYLLH